MMTPCSYECVHEDGGIDGRTAENTVFVRLPEWEVCQDSEVLVAERQSMVEMEQIVSFASGEGNARSGRRKAPDCHPAHPSTCASRMTMCMAASVLEWFTSRATLTP